MSELVGRRAVLPALQRSATAELLAVASRDPERARSEAAAFGAARSFGSYQALLDDPSIEAVYIPLPNSLHREWTLRAAAAGKHVLCEKPLACTAAEAQEMADACAGAGVLLMEAYMTPFHPRSERLLDLVRRGRLGELRFAHTAFTFTAADPGRKSYRWLPEMGGGSLLDTGIYCLAPLLAAAGRMPATVDARMVTGSTGIDTSFSAWLDFGGGLTAAFETSFEVPERQVLEIAGTAARLTVERAHTPGPDDTELTIAGADGAVERVVCPGADPYLLMVEHYAAAVRGEAPLRRTPAESIAVLQVLDRLRAAASPVRSL